MGRYVVAGFALLFLLPEIAQLCLCGKCIESEKQALLKFKASFIHDPINLLSSWNPKNNCCQWDGIVCHNVTGHILKLNIGGLEATSVDPSLLQLQHLFYLDLGGSNFNGIPVPIFFGSMKQLRYLSIYGANFSGKIPPNLGNLTNMLFLDLSYNDLHTNDMNWVPNLQSLQYLNLSGVYLGEAHNLFQVLHMLPSLLQLQLFDCGLHNLSTPLPPINFTNNARLQVLNLARNEIDSPILDAFQNWTSIEFLYLYSNNLSSMPLWLGKFNSLLELDIGSNVLYGPLPFALQNLTSIKVLELYDNYLTLVPSWLGEFKNLVVLDLSRNALHGPIPVAFRNLTSLEHLLLSQNNLSSIPSWLRELKGLRRVDISSNKLTIMKTFLSSIFRNICHLEVLDLSYNNLQGKAFGDSKFSGCIRYDIEELYLRSNKLNGHLPTRLGHLASLTKLDLSYNSFSGNIPQSLGQLANLTQLDLSHNSFSGNIPQSLGQLPQLNVLKLSSNNLQGALFNWSSFMQFNYLNLSNNQINGSIPKSFCKIETLITLDVSKNNLSGEIPNCWSDNGLREINFSFNKLSGVFPISFSKISSLFWLHLNNNYLKGKLPLTFKNSKQLRILDLGENQFSRSIPSWTGNTFPSLQILRLRQNMLDGSIPSHLCQLTSLHILDLANNNLTGSIPNCIGNLSGMTKYNADMWKSSNQTLKDSDVKDILQIEWPDEEVKQVMKGIEYDITRILQFVVNMDLSNNNLAGFIPIEISLLTGLITLNLSKNHLKGKIPEMIGDMKSLESFDISSNQFSGTIPKSMSSLTSLSHLNMSHNNLSGPIPTENQFLTLNDPSIYVGNPYLCGIPLPNKCHGNETHHAPETKESQNENDSDKVCFYFVITVGFIVGFWGVIGTLVLNKSWRYACFRRVEDVIDEIYVTIVIKATKLKRMLRNHFHG